MTSERYSLQVSSTPNGRESSVTVLLLEAGNELLNVTYVIDKRDSGAPYFLWKTIFDLSLSKEKQREYLIVLSQVVKSVGVEKIIRDRDIAIRISPPTLLSEIEGNKAELQCETEWVKEGYGTKKYDFSAVVELGGRNAGIRSLWINSLSQIQESGTVGDTKRVQLSGEYFGEIGIEDSDGVDEAFEARKLGIPPESIFSFSFSSKIGEKWVRFPGPSASLENVFSEAGHLNFRVLIPSNSNVYRTGSKIAGWIVVYGPSKARDLELEKASLHCQSTMIRFSGLLDEVQLKALYERDGLFR